MGPSGCATNTWCAGAACPPACGTDTWAPLKLSCTRAQRGANTWGAGAQHTQHAQHAQHADFAAASMHPCIARRWRRGRPRGLQAVWLRTRLAAVWLCRPEQLRWGLGSVPSARKRRRDCRAVREQIAVPCNGACSQDALPCESAPRLGVRTSPWRPCVYRCHAARDSQANTVPCEPCTTQPFKTCDPALNGACSAEVESYSWVNHAKLFSWAWSNLTIAFSLGSPVSGSSAAEWPVGISVKMRRSKGC